VRIGPAASIVCIAALATGCAPSLQQQAVEVELQPICCSSPDAFDYVPLDVGASARLEFEQGAPVFDFGDGKSYVRGIKLGTGSGRWLEIRSSLSLAQPGNQYFHPVVTFYDERFVRISSFESRLAPRLDSPFGEIHEAGDVQVPETAIYAVFWTSQQVMQHWAREIPSLAERMIVTEPIYVPAYTGRLDVKLKILFGAGG
jgi:hypothetical protein